MSGMQYLPLDVVKLFPALEITAEEIKRREQLRNRTLSAGHSQTTARLVHDAAIEYSQKTGRTYEQVYEWILETISVDDNSRQNLNLKLDKFSQPFRPGPDQAKNKKDAAIIMKAQHRNKSSKGKHPSNLTPPKKKRK